MTGIDYSALGGREKCRATPETWEILLAKRENMRQAGCSMGHGLDHTAFHAAMAAQRYLTDGHAASDFEHGNGTVYALHFANLNDLCLAGRWGGELLISMPGLGKRCVATCLQEYCHPSFAEAHFGLRHPDAVWVAEFISLFCSAVASQHKETTYA